MGNNRQKKKKAAEKTEVSGSGFFATIIALNILLLMFCLLLLCTDDINLISYGKRRLELFLMAAIFLGSVFLGIYKIQILKDDLAGERKFSAEIYKTARYWGLVIVAGLLNCYAVYECWKFANLIVSQLQPAERFVCDVNAFREQHGKGQTTYYVSFELNHKNQEVWVSKHDKSAYFGKPSSNYRIDLVCGKGIAGRYIVSIRR
jgi:hypothetical protein